jgi:hypothetical protein
VRRAALRLIYLCIDFFSLKKLVPPTSGAASGVVSTDVVSTFCGARRRCWLLHRFPPDSESFDTLQRQNCRLLSKTKLSLATVVEKDTWCLDSEWSGYSVPQVPSETCTSSIYRYSVPWFRRKNRGLKYPYAYRWYANAYRWYGTWSIQTKICFLTKKPAYKIIPMLHISMKIYVCKYILTERQSPTYIENKNPAFVHYMIRVRKRNQTSNINKDVFRMIPLFRQATKMYLLVNAISLILTKLRVIFMNLITAWIKPPIFFFYLHPLSYTYRHYMSNNRLIYIWQILSDSPLLLLHFKSYSFPSPH